MTVLEFNPIVVHETIGANHDVLEVCPRATWDSDASDHTMSV
jgi:hypothetical protein